MTEQIDTSVDDFVKLMRWGDDTSEDIKGLVIGNVRGFWGWKKRQLEAEKRLTTDENSV